MSLKLRSDGTANSVEIDAPAGLASEVSITLPAVTGGEFVVTDASGNIDLGPLDINGGAADNSVNIDSSGRLLVGTSSAAGGQVEAKTATVAAGNPAYDKKAFIANIPYSTTNITSSLLAGFDGGAIHGVDIGYRYNGTGYDLTFGTNSTTTGSPTERLRLTSAGLFQSMPIYNTTGGDAANVVVNSAGTVYRSTSSAKYKTDIETLQDQYADAVLELRPVWYRSTCEIDNPDWSYWGFIAEEVAEIDPRLVSWKTSETSYDENGAVIQTPLETPEPEGVQYDRFVPHLLNLIKRQQQAIETLEAKVAALESA